MSFRDKLMVTYFNDHKLYRAEDISKKKKCYNYERVIEVDYLIIVSKRVFVLSVFQLPMGHRVVILNTIEKVVGVSIDTLSKSLAVDLIKQASEELTHSKVWILLYLYKFNPYAAGG